MKKGMVAVLTGLTTGVASAVVTGKIVGSALEEKKKKVDKFKSYYNMLNQWLIIKQQGKSLEKFFEDRNITNIAIYGMGEMGNRLYEELKDSKIEVKYAIDKNASSTYSELKVCELDEELEKVDAIVVTAVFAFDEIEEGILHVYEGTVISLEDVVYEI